MPRKKIAGWGPVTLTISGEVSRALQILSALKGEEMGREADKAMRKGGLLESYQRALLKESTLAAPLSAGDVGPSSSITAAAPEGVAQQPDNMARKKRKRTETGDPELFKYLETLRLNSKIVTTKFMGVVAPGILPGNYNSSWMKAGHVPRKYVQSVRDYLASQGFEGIPPAK